MAIVRLSHTAAQVDSATDTTNSHVANLNNPHETTATQVGANTVSSVREGADRNGITMNCVSTGAIYSYFTGIGTISADITIPASQTFEIANEDDFPELALYQGDPLVEGGRNFIVQNTGGQITLVDKNISVAVGMVDANDKKTISIINFDTSNPLVLPANSQFTFNKMLVLGTPSGG